MFSQHLISSTTPTLSRRRQNQRSRASEIARCQIPPRRAAEQQTDYARNDIPDPNAAAAPPRSVSADCVSAIPVGSASPREPAAGPPALRAPQPPQPPLRGILGGTATDRPEAGSDRPGAEQRRLPEKSLYFPPAPAGAARRRWRGRDGIRSNREKTGLSV